MKANELRYGDVAWCGMWDMPMRYRGVAREAIFKDGQGMHRFVDGRGWHEYLSEEELPNLSLVIRDGKLVVQGRVAELEAENARLKTVLERLIVAAKPICEATGDNRRDNRNLYIPGQYEIEQLTDPQGNAVNMACLREMAQAVKDAETTIGDNNEE